MWPKAYVKSSRNGFLDYLRIFYSYYIKIDSLRIFAPALCITATQANHLQYRHLSRMVIDNPANHEGVASGRFKLLGQLLQFLRRNRYQQASRSLRIGKDIDDLRGNLFTLDDVWQVMFAVAVAAHRD